MYNPIDFEAGKKWSNGKTQLFNVLFSGLRISFDWQGKDVDFLTNLKSLRRLTIESVRTLDISAIDK